MSRLIAVSGHRGSGKNTTADWLTEKYKYIQVSFAAKLKDMVSALYQVPREDLDHPTRKEMPLVNLPVIPTDAFTEALHSRLQSELSSGYWTPRALCILEGSVKRSVYANYWVKQVLGEVIENPNSRYVITDLRYKSEVDVLNMLFPEVLLLRVERKGLVLTTQDPSERDLDDYPFETRILNHGTIQDLHGTVDLVLNHMGIYVPQEK